jgi:integrase
MSQSPRNIMTLMQLRESIGTDASLAKQARSELCSAITRFCKIAGVDPSQVLADPTAIRELRKTASWQIAGINQRSWANIVSRVTKAMSHAGVDVDRRRRNTRLLPVWDALLGQLGPEHWKRLRRFAGWCSARGVAPSDVTPETFTAFFQFLQTQSVQRNLRARWHEARCTWNKAVARPGSNYPHIPNNAPARWRGMTWSDFPEALHADLAAWRNYLAHPEIDDDREALRPVTIKNYDLALRRCASRMVENGRPVEDIGSLSRLLDPDWVKRALQAIKGDGNSDQARARVHIVAQALLSVARFNELKPLEPGFEAQQQQFTSLRKIAAKARVQPVGMVRKNRDRLAKLDDPTAARMFRNLHATVAARYDDVQKPTIAQAHEMQMAAMHVLLMDLPLRVKNVAELDLDHHITRPPGGTAGPWRVAFQGHEMKNGQPFEAMLGEEASAFLADYVARFRPVLLKGPSSILFVSRTGQAKQPTTLSKQFSGFIRRELGLQVNPHLLRHHAGMLWLNNMPGEYQPLSKLLGHSSSATTERSYTGAETKTAQHRYHGLLDALRAQDRAQEAARREAMAQLRRGGASR